MPSLHDPPDRASYASRVRALTPNANRRWGATAAKPLDSEWGTHVAFGKLTGRQASRLSALHLDHRLRQFGA